jgi:hypothetical protein
MSNPNQARYLTLICEAERWGNQRACTKLPLSTTLLLTSWRLTE